MVVAGFEKRRAGGKTWGTSPMRAGVRSEESPDWREAAGEQTPTPRRRFPLADTRGHGFKGPREDQPAVSKKDVIRRYDALGQPPFLGMPPKFHDLCLQATGRVVGRVLDIGCGHGVLLERLLGACHPLQAYGCDLSSAMCSRAASRNPAAAIVQADAEELPFADDSFDHVFMVEVLEHVPEVGRALREVKRILRAGGTFLVAVPNKDWFHYERHMRTREKNQPIDDHWHWYGAAEIKGLLAGCGFALRKVRGGENLYFGGGIPRELEKLALRLAPKLHEKSKRLILLSVNEK
jgi:ubiquinone/menaquinone biosynthesis C-methylase UbiE